MVALGIDRIDRGAQVPDDFTIGDSQPLRLELHRLSRPVPYSTAVGLQLEDQGRIDLNRASRGPFLSGHMQSEGCQPIQVPEKTYRKPRCISRWRQGEIYNPAPREHASGAEPSGMEQRLAAC